MRRFVLFLAIICNALRTPIYAPVIPPFMPPLFLGEFGRKGNVGEEGGRFFDSFEVAAFGHDLIMTGSNGVGMVSNRLSTLREPPSFCGFSESLTPSGGRIGGRLNIEQEILALFRLLDSERQTNVLEVLGEILRSAMEEMGVERKIGEEGGEENV